MIIANPYEILEELLETGEIVTLRAIAKKYVKVEEEMDGAIVSIEQVISAYQKSCEKTGEEPVITLNEVTDEVESPCLFDATAVLVDLQNKATIANRAWFSYYLRKMPWESFEMLCKELLEKMYVSDVQLTNRGPDSGIDFTGQYFNPMLKEVIVPIIGQAKRWAPATPVGVEAVRSLIAKLATHKSPAAHGFLITTSYFTQEAVEEAKASPKRIYLWDMRDLIWHLVDLKVGVSPIGSDIETIDHPHWERFLEPK
jgi:restriction endonuclease Mrr